MFLFGKRPSELGILNLVKVVEEVFVGRKIAIYNNDFTSIIDIFFNKTLSTPNL